MCSAESGQYACALGDFGVDFCFDLRLRLEAGPGDAEGSLVISKVGFGVK